MRLCGRAGFQIAGWSITASQAGHCSNTAGREVVNTKKKKKKKNYQSWALCPSNAHWSYGLWSSRTWASCWSGIWVDLAIKDGILSEAGPAWSWALMGTRQRNMRAPIADLIMYVPEISSLSSCQYLDTEKVSRNPTDRCLSQISNSVGSETHTYDSPEPPPFKNKSAMALPKFLS